MRKLLILVGLLLISVTISGAPVLAQLDEWECLYDFTESDGGFASSGSFTSGDGGTWTDSVGWEDNYGFSGTNAYRMVQIGISFASTTLMSVDITYEITNGTQDTGEPGSISTHDTNLVVTTTPFADGPGVFSWSGTATAEAISFRIQSGFDQSGSSDGGGSVTVTELELTGEGPSPCAPLEFVKPLRSSDLDNEWNVIETYSAGFVNAQKTMLMYSDAIGAKVHSPTPGTVTNIHKMQVGDCYSYFASPVALVAPWGCGVSVHGYGFWLQGTFVTTPVQVVTIEGDNGYRFVYFVKNADDYITEGQHIEADCWIGETFYLDTLTIGAGIGPFGLGADAPGAGGVTMWSLQEAAVPIDGPDLFSIEPNGTGPCNQPEGYESCLGDAPLNIPSQWDVGGATWNEPGITLQPNGSIKTTMNLLETLNPEMKVMAQSIGGSGSFTMQLGQTVEVKTATPTAAEFEIAADEHEADIAGLYTVRVKNTSAVSIRLTYICVQNTTDEGGDPVDPPPDGPPDTPNDTDNVCIFSNNSFTDSTTGWTVTGVDVAAGEIRVADAGTFSQSITLQPDTYTLTVVASIWSYNAFVPDDTETDDVTIEWDFPADATYDGSGSKTFGQFAENNNLVVYQMEVVVGSETTGDFKMRVSLESVPSGVRGIAIKSVCLGDDTGGEGGGGDGQPGDSGPFEVSCTATTAPSGDGFGAWISWQWGKFRSFFTCELMIVLNNMYDLMQDTYRLFGWSIRYSQAVAVQSMNWIADQLLPWFGGHLSNIAVGQVTTITTEEQCGNVFCLLTGIFDSVFGTLNGILDILNQLTDPNSPFWGVVQSFFDDLFDFFNDLSQQTFGLLNRLLDLIFQVLGLLGAIIITIISFILMLLAKAYEIFNIITSIVSVVMQGWNNAVPIESAILPSCAMDQTSARCMIFYITHHTVFTESGAYFPGVMAAGIVLNALTWVVRRAVSWLKDWGTL